MDREAWQALKIVRQCTANGRYRLVKHFTERLDERGLYWGDVLAALDDPADVRDGGPETQGRPKWIIAGTGRDGQAVELVCVLDVDERGKRVLYVTIY